MIRIRKRDNVISIGKGKKPGESSSSEKAEESQSPFDSKPVEALRSITERKSRGLTEEQRLKLLQNALEPFAKEARSRLPGDVKDIEKEMRKKMIQEGFAKEWASEAGDETVSAILDARLVEEEEDEESVHSSE